MVAGSKCAPLNKVVSFCPLDMAAVSSVYLHVYLDFKAFPRL